MKNNKLLPSRYHWRYCKDCRRKTMQEVHINPIPRPQRYADDRDDGVIWQCLNYQEHRGHK